MTLLYNIFATTPFAEFVPAYRWKRIFLFCVAATVLGLFGTSAWAGGIVPDSLTGLQAWYEVDSASGSVLSDWPDSGTNNYDMQQTSASYQPALVSGQAGGYDSVDFDGSDYMSAGNHEVHSNTDGLTVIAVAKPDTTTGGVIASKFNYASPQRQWRLYTGAFDVQETNTSWNTHSVARMNPEPGVFHTVSGVWTPTTAAQVYLDSRLMDTAAQTVNDMTNTGAELLLGACNAGAASRLDGMISEVAVYNRALSPKERTGVEQYLQAKYNLAPNNGPFGVDINFQAADPGDGGLPPGYVLDRGHTFGHRGDGLFYGWSQDATGQARDRDKTASPDERFDTLVHLHNGAWGPAEWDLAVPEGTYWVRAVFGDPDPNANINDVSIEGRSFSDPDPSTPSDWDEYFGQITVTDGQLTIGQRSSGDGAKIDFFQLREVTNPQIAINFQTGTSTAGLPDNYLTDGGQAFGDRGNGMTYGWIDPDTGAPLSNTHNARNRNSGNSPEERYDTLNHLWNGGSQHYGWEIELKDGLYSVLAVFGEPANPPTNSTNHIWFENTLFHDPDPYSGNDWDLFMGTLEVTDGRLTITDTGISSGAKICFLEITAVPEPSSLVLVFAGLVALAGFTRRKKHGRLPAA